MWLLSPARQKIALQIKLKRRFGFSEMCEIEILYEKNVSYLKNSNGLNKRALVRLRVTWKLMFNSKSFKLLEYIQKAFDFPVTRKYSNYTSYLNIYVFTIKYHTNWKEEIYVPISR